MAQVSWVELVPAKQAEDSQTTQYTVPDGSSAIIDSFTVTNNTGTAATLSVNIIADGGSSGDSNLIVKTRSVAANSTRVFHELIGKQLDSGTFISTIAGTASALTIHVTGRELR